MSEIRKQLSDIHSEVSAAADGRGDVELVAVSKTFPASDIRAAFEAGHRVFGESRLQEAKPKIEELPKEIEWHFIGRVQRNKVRKILPLFSYIHAVDSMKLAAYVDGVAKEIGIQPKIFLQINQAGEQTKGGFSESELRMCLPELEALRHIKVIGLMTIPPADKASDDARNWFRKLRKFRDTLRSESSLDLSLLSMGMSSDFQIAIEEGATHVRVGSAIFGKREYKVEGELG